MWSIDIRLLIETVCYKKKCTDPVHYATASQIFVVCLEEFYRTIVEMFEILGKFFKKFIVIILISFWRSSRSISFVPGKCVGNLRDPDDGKSGSLRPVPFLRPLLQREISIQSLVTIQRPIRESIWKAEVHLKCVQNLSDTVLTTASLPRD